MKSLPNIRDKSVRFVARHSGNAGGRLRDEHKLAELGRSYTNEALDTLVELMHHGKDDRVRGTAAQALLERGWGKPRVEVATTRKSESQSYIEALQEVAYRGNLQKV